MKYDSIQKCKQSFKILGVIISLVQLMGCSSEATEEFPIPQNASPKIVSQSFEVPENTSQNTVVGTVSAEDPDGDDLKFFIVEGSGFQIRLATGELLVANADDLDFETLQNIELTIRVQDGKGGSSSATISIAITDVDDGPFTNNEKDFISEYHYLTYKLSPTASGATVSEKWGLALKLYLSGSITNEYRSRVQGYIDTYNSFFTDGFVIELVDTEAASNVRLILGPESAVSNVWPDMYQLINGGNFGGYALYNSDFNYNINFGRIWVKTDTEPIFLHELGHIIGLGHTRSAYCGNTERNSIMCSGPASNFSTWDREIIKILYRSEITTGKSFNDLKPLIEQFLLDGEVKI
jgi:hypothetical protein